MSYNSRSFKNPNASPYYQHQGYTTNPQGDQQTPTSRSYVNPNADPYYQPQGYTTNPQGYQQPPTSNSPYYGYSNATVMQATRSQDSSGSSNSTYSSNSYPSSYNVSPPAYSPTETHGYGNSQPGYSALSQSNSTTEYLTPGHGHQYPPTATPRQSISTTTQAKSPSPTSTSKSAPYVCVYPGCTRSFARPYDLDRHMKVHFPHEKYDCPQGRRENGFCKRVGEHGFTRKDHLDEHLRKVHMLDLPKSARGTRSR